MNRLEEKMKRSSGIIAIVLMIVGVSLVIGICLSFAFTVWVLNDVDRMVQGNILYQTLLQELRVQSAGEIAAELCTGIVSGLFLLSALTTTFRIFRAIRGGVSPFSMESTKKLKRVGALALIYAIVYPIARAGFYKTFAANTNLSHMIDPAFVVVALILFAVAVVFDYGAELQRQSDETL